MEINIGKPTPEVLVSKNPSSEYAYSLDLPPFPEIPDDYLPENVLVHFHFAPHAIPEHLDATRQLYTNADIFIPEVPGWDSKRLKDFTAISKGDSKILGRMIDAQRNNPLKALNEELLKIIHGKYKPITFIDATSEQPELASAGRKTGHLMDCASESIEDTLENFAKDLAIKSKKVALRDRIMVRNLGESVTNIASPHPRLKKASQVLALAFMGFNHEPVYHYLRDQPASTNNVAASLWSSIRKPEIGYELMDIYKVGETPTKDQMIELMITYAVGVLQTPGLEGEAMYSQYRAYTRKLDVRMAVAKSMISNMVNGETDGAHELANDILGDNLTDEKREQIRDYQRQAAEDVIERLERATSE